MTADVRAQHPYYMHDAICAQPEAFRSAIDRNRQGCESLSEKIAGIERLYLVGIGTSFHAAAVGEHLFRAWTDVAVQAVPSFDFALYGPRLTPRDMVVAISHRGTKRFSREALERAHAAGCSTALVTGLHDPGVATVAKTVFSTVAQEKSSAHTISYISSIAVLAELARAIGERQGTARDVESLPIDEMPAAIRAGLALEGEAARLASLFHERRRIWLVGGGPSAITAQEVALKIKETSYLQAEGLAIEAMLHGPFQCAEAEDLFVLIAPSGQAQPRVLELSAMADDIGARSIVVHDGTAGDGATNAEGSLVVPAVAEPLSAVTCLVPLQLFAYHLALARGTNPDTFRADDPRFKQANGRITL